MAGRLIGAWNPALDAAGLPISGSKLNTYTAGTTTNLATYPTAADADAGTNARANPVVADSAGRFGEIWAPDGSSYDLKWTDAAGVQIALFEDIDALSQAAAGSVLRGYLAGLTSSTAGSSANMAIAAGQATDGAATALMTLAAALTKTTGAWAVGTNQGGLDTGSIANSTWYHWYLIERPDTGVVDVCFSTSASAPTTGGNIPSAYTLSRRIFSAKTDGSAHWVRYYQSGDEFLWDTPVGDVSSATFGTTATLQALTVPSGIKVSAILNVTVANSASAMGALISAPDQPVQAAGVPAGNYNLFAPTAVQSGAATLRIRTDTSRQIRAVSDHASSTISITTQGWTDRRGRDD